jgi:lysophospholipase L1-like esterase
MCGKNKRNMSAVCMLIFLVSFVMNIWPVPLLGADPVRIMPLGDSITAGQGCWRAYLWNALQTNGYTDIDFVGSVDSGGCPVEFDSDCEGHGGIAATGMADNDQLPPWLDEANPDIVLMHLGTNDMWGGYIPLEDKLAAFTKLVDQMRANNPDMKIIVAQIIPMSESACSTCPDDVVALDNAIPGWADGKSTSQSPIIVVDQWTGFNADTDTRDGVHPNDEGEHKMADKWYPPLAALLSGSTPTSAPTPTGGTRGDANGNGSIDIVDALLVAQYYVGLNPSGFIPANADTNCDNAINIVDALLIAQLYVGLITHFC